MSLLLWLVVLFTVVVIGLIVFGVSIRLIEKGVSFSQKIATDKWRANIKAHSLKKYEMFAVISFFIILAFLISTIIFSEVQQWDSLYQSLVFLIIMLLLMVQVIYILVPIVDIRYEFGNKEKQIKTNKFIERGINYLLKRQKNYLISGAKFFIQRTVYSFAAATFLYVICLIIVASPLLGENDIYVFTSISVLIAFWSNSIYFETSFYKRLRKNEDLETVKVKFINQKRILAYLIIALLTLTGLFQEYSYLFNGPSKEYTITKYLLNSPLIVFIAFDRLFKAINDDYSNHKKSLETD